MKRYFLVLFCIAIAEMIHAISPPTMEKTVVTETKRLFKNVEFSVSALPISEKQKANGAYFLIKTAQNQQFKYAYIGRVITSRSDNKNEGSDYLDYIAFFNALFVVQKVKVVRFSSEHGAEVCSAGWLKQFVGHSPSNTLIVGKNVDAVSGATYTVNTFTFDIQSKTYILKQTVGSDK